MVRRGVKAIDPSGEHILHIAANCPDSKMIALLAEQWPGYINTANEDGITPLHVASMYGQLSAIKSLIENGADPFAVDNEEMTPLDYSCREQHTCCVKYFQDIGITPAAEDENDEEDSMAIAYTSLETTILDGYNDSTLCYSLNDTDITLVEEHDNLQQLTNSMICNELIKKGEKPGPINDLTRGAYLRYLHKVNNGLLPTHAEGIKFNSKC